MEPILLQKETSDQPYQAIGKHRVDTGFTLLFHSTCQVGADHILILHNQFQGFNIQKVTFSAQLFLLQQGYKHARMRHTVVMGGDVSSIAMGSERLSQAFD